MYANFLKKEPKRKTEIVFLSVLLFIIFCFACYFVFYVRYLPGKILEKALSYMEGSDQDLEVIICEKGTGYQILLEGYIAGNRDFYGKIADFNLELYCPKDKDLLIKDEKDGQWKEASLLNLKSLNGFINPPFALLKICNPLFSKAKFQGNPHRTKSLILLRIPPELLDKWYPTVAKDFGSKLSLDCVVAVNQKTSFIDEVNLSFIDKSTGEGFFNRSYSYRPLENNSFKTIYPPKLEYLNNNI